MPRTILITGASSGIGYDAALCLRDRGWRVFASCRQPDDCTRMRSEGFESPHIDYCNPASIASGLNAVLEATDGTLDALFNNGAHGCSGLIEDLQTEGLRQIFEANVFGWHDLTRRVIPVMRAQGQGRIVQCSSTLGFTNIPWRGAYSATKHALTALSSTMRMELRGTGIHVSILEPGPITTRFRENQIPYVERHIDWRNSVRRADYEAGLLRRLRETGRRDMFELPPAAVSRCLVHALESRNPRRHYRITWATRIAAGLKKLLPAGAQEVIASRI